VWADARNPFFKNEKTRKGTKIRVAASTEGIALAKFLCAKVDFTQLCRRRYGAPAARRYEADFPLPSPKNQKTQKSFLKMRKSFKVSNLRIGFWKIFHKKEDFGR